MEVHPDDAHAGQGSGFDVVDAAAHREEALKTARDIGFDLLRRHSVVKRRNHYHRDVHRWEHVHRHPDEAGDTDNSDNQADDDDEIGRPDREPRHLLTFLGSADRRDFRVHLLSAVQTGAVADHHQISFRQSGANLDHTRGLNPQRDAPRLAALLWYDVD